MAKRAGVTERHGESAAASKIVDYAEDLGHFLGSVRAKVSSYNSERQRLAKHLSTLVADAQQLLAELGHSAAVAVRRGRRAGGATKTSAPQRRRERPEGTGRKRRKLSAAARERIRQAQLKRWAKVRAAAGK